MKFLRRISTRQLLALAAALVVLAAAATALALAATGAGPQPEPKPLAAAIHDALTAPAPQGVSAQVEFTNRLIDGAVVQGSDPLLSGASGRLWASSDGRLRLELQADVSNGGGSGDSQVLVDRNRFTIYDSGTNTAYEGAFPNQPNKVSGEDQPPSLAQVQEGIARAMQHATLSEAVPSDLAGQPAYTVHASPKSDGGLFGGAELAWDAASGVPLQAAVYARGESSPVLELKATEVSFGAVPDSVFEVTPPPGAKVVDLGPPEGGTKEGGHEAPPVTGLDAVQRQTSFRVSAPPSLAGMAQGEVRLISSGKDAGALVTYGHGLGGIAVLELPAAGGGSTGGSGGGEQGALSLPKVGIGGGVSGQELATALGTAIRFQRDGVEYTVVGSVPTAVALAAARGL